MKPQLHEDWIDPFAFKIVKNLQESGFETYLVGGCVRDLLVGIHPKDFDIATSALPQQIRKKISNSFIIGRRFKLVLVKRNEHQFEVATFRRNVNTDDLSDSDANVEGDNYFGTCEEDAKRRDFTINALFYDPVQHKLIDYCKGMYDIEHRILRMIGDPHERLKEDPIRILRAIRLSHKVGFVIEPQMKQALQDCASELQKSVLPRRREEYLKFLRLPQFNLALTELFDLGILQTSLPTLHTVFADPDRSEIFNSYLQRMDESAINKADPLELFSALLLAYFKATYADENWNLEALENDPQLINFVKDELGIFKQEMTQFFTALSMIGSLKRIESYSRKGERRQAAFIHNPSFLLSFKLAYMGCFLNPLEINFWLEQYKKINSQDPSTQLNADSTDS